MLAREFFEQAREAQRAIDRRISGLESMCSREGVRAQRYDTIGKSFGIRDVMAQTDARMDAERYAMEEIQELNGEVADARAVCRGIRAANPNHEIWGDILEFRYLEDMPWRRLADAMGISVRTAQVEHAAALDWVDSVGIAAARSGCGQAALL